MSPRIGAAPKPHAFRLRPARLFCERAALALCALLVAASCQRPRTKDSATPAGNTPSSGEAMAASLPTFDTAPTSTEGPRSDVPFERYHVALGDAPTRGPATAPVTIVMFSDFECPYCTRGYETLRALEEKHRGVVRIAYKAFPLDNHPNALMAAMAARTAQSAGRFWEFHDLLFSGAELEQARLFAFARQAGISESTLSADLTGLRHAPAVAKDLRQARRLGVSSTPTFFVNGRLVRGAQSLEELEELVLGEAALAKGWAERGVPATGLYAYAIRDGFRKVAYTKRRGIDPDRVYEVPIEASPTKGPAEAPITIVAFGDFECPYCVRGHEVLSKVFAAYPGQIRLVFKHQPLSFHSHAFLAARATMAAHAQGKFWAFHDALYALEASFDEDDLTGVARSVGLDVPAFRKAMAGTSLDPAIAHDQALAASLGIRGTPAFFINGRPLEGAQPELAFRLLIEEEFLRVKALRDRGIAPRDLYDALLREPLD